MQRIQLVQSTPHFRQIQVWRRTCCPLSSACLTTLMASAPLPFIVKLVVASRVAASTWSALLTNRPGVCRRCSDRKNAANCCSSGGTLQTGCPSQMTFLNDVAGLLWILAVHGFVRAAVRHAVWLSFLGEAALSSLHQMARNAPFPASSFGPAADSQSSLCGPCLIAKSGAHPDSTKTIPVGGRCYIQVSCILHCTLLLLCQLLLLRWLLLMRPLSRAAGLLLGFCRWYKMLTQQRMSTASGLLTTHSGQARHAWPSQAVLLASKWGVWT